jgi:hypothetical protein
MADEGFADIAEIDLQGSLAIKGHRKADHALTIRS